MNIKIIAILHLICSAAPKTGFCQHFLKQVEISAGFAWLPQDRRLFEYPGRAEVIYYESTRFDHEYFILLNKNLYDKKWVTVSAGAGYAMLRSTFSRPFDHNYFTGARTLELKHIDTYNGHQLRLANTSRLNLIHTGRHTLSLGLSFYVNFYTNKEVESIRIGNVWHKNKWKFEFNNFEIYPGIRYAYNKFNIGFFYRAFNVQAIDPVIFNEILFTHRNPPFLSKKYETLNLNKMMISVGYRF